MGDACAGVVTQDHSPAGYRNSAEQPLAESPLIPLKITVRTLAMETCIIL